MTSRPDARDGDGDTDTDSQAPVILAPGMAEVIAREPTFASPEEAAAFWNVGGERVDTRELTYRGAAGQDQAVRLYLGGTARSPTLLYIHGGGWVGGSIDLQDRSARRLAVRGECNVASISYRLAPVHPYPAGLHDCLAAVEWLRAEGPALGLDLGCLVVGGGSAGANLAVAAALSRPGVFSALLLYYGVFGCDFETESYRRYAEGPSLTRARMIEFFDMYDPGGLRGRDPLITPLLSDRLGALPATALIAAEHDVLIDENRAFADSLRAAGVPVSFTVEPGLTHGYANRGRLSPRADEGVDPGAHFLKQLGQARDHG